jgi:hypothetical protein
MNTPHLALGPYQTNCCTDISLLLTRSCERGQDGTARLGLSLLGCTHNDMLPARDRPDGCLHIRKRLRRMEAQITVSQK